MKTLLPWLCALALLGAAGFFYSSNRKLAGEVAELRQHEAQVQELRTELEQVKATGSPVQAEEISKLRKDNQDLLKLRNEVRQLREGNKDLTQQAQRAQSQAEAARSQVQVLSTNLQAAHVMAALQAQAARAATQTASTQDAATTCVNNLRQIDGAIQQWALENKKDARAVPNANDLAPYLRGQAIPKCPAGGNYTIRSVAESPTCSIPGHVLPQQ
jgi:chromosome segregation ATPase